MWELKPSHREGGAKESVSCTSTSPSSACLSPCDLLFWLCLWFRSHDQDTCSKSPWRMEITQHVCTVIVVRKETQLESLPLMDDRVKKVNQLFLQPPYEWIIHGDFCFFSSVSRENTWRKYPQETSTIEYPWDFLKEIRNLPWNTCCVRNGEPVFHLPTCLTITLTLHWLGCSLSLSTAFHFSLSSVSNVEWIGRVFLALAVSLVKYIFCLLVVTKRNTCTASFEVEYLWWR